MITPDDIRYVIYEKKEYYVCPNLQEAVQSLEHLEAKYGKGKFILTQESFESFKREGKVISLLGRHKKRG